jgi:diadenylate cyclase
VAVGGSIIRDIDRDSLRNKLEYLRKKTVDVKSFKIWRGRLKNERKDI